MPGITQPRQATASLAEPAVTLSAVSKRFRGHLVLDALCTEIPAGRITCVMGLNGCGKSTLLCLLAGFMHPTGGTITHHYAAAATAGANANGGGMAAFLDPASCHPWHSPRRHLRWIAATKGINAGAEASINAAIEAAGLTRDANRPLARCSLGIRQRTGIAGAMLSRPKLLLLDEPHNGLDLDAAWWLTDATKALRNSGTAVVIATHDAAWVEANADDILLLHASSLLCHAPVESLTAPHSSLEATLRELLHPTEAIT